MIKKNDTSSQISQTHSTRVNDSVNVDRKRFQYTTYTTSSVETLNIAVINLLRFLCKNNIRLVFTPICFVGRFMFYLCYFYLFTYSGVQHELFTYSDHMNSPLQKVNSCVTQFLVVCVIFCGTLFVFAPFTSPSILRQTLIIDSCLMGSPNSISSSYMN